MSPWDGESMIVINFILLQALFPPRKPLCTVCVVIIFQLHLSPHAEQVLMNTVEYLPHWSFKSLEPPVPLVFAVLRDNHMDICCFIWYEAVHNLCHLSLAYYETESVCCTGRCFCLNLLYHSFLALGTCLHISTSKSSPTEKVQAPPSLYIKAALVCKNTIIMSLLLFFWLLLHDKIRHISIIYICIICILQWLL